MQTIAFEKARHYPVPKHHGMVAFRLQGLDVTKTNGTWVGLSVFLPGGGAETDAGPTEKIYVVIEGEITIEVDGRRQKLGKFDSCHIGPGEERAVVNETNAVVQMLVIVPGGAA